MTSNKFTKHIHKDDTKIKNSTVVVEKEVSIDLNRHTPTENINLNNSEFKTNLSINGLIFLTIILIIGMFISFSKEIKSFNIKDILESPWQIQKGKSNDPPLKEISNDIPNDFCSPSTEKDKYVLIIDAGSQGSRIHIYHFKENQRNTLDQIMKQDGLVFPKLVNETYYHVIPGLSSYADDNDNDNEFAIKASKSLNQLLNKALNIIPKEFHDDIQLAIKATAGLRLIGVEKSELILKEIEKNIIENYSFLKIDNGNEDNKRIEVMDGKYEAIYSWITLNYLLGRIGHDYDKEFDDINNDNDDNQELYIKGSDLNTAAIIDLGGASTQIVFEPKFPNDNYLKNQYLSLLEPGDHKYEVEFSGLNYTLYQHSHLGYGIMEARKMLRQLLFNNELENRNSSSFEEEDGLKVITNPCIAVNLKRDVKISKNNGKSEIIRMKGPTLNDNKQESLNNCYELTKEILNLDTHCLHEPCSFDGIHQPSINEFFNKEEDIFIISYFYYRLTPLGISSEFTLIELSNLIENVCYGKEYWIKNIIKNINNNEDILFELNDRPEWCFDLTFIYSMLRFGYGINETRKLNVLSHIDNNEIGWSLGNALSLLTEATRMEDYTI